MDSLIRPVTLDDACQITEIYNHYIENSVATFEEEILSVGDMEQRIAGIISRFPYYVTLSGNRITGYGYASPFRPRISYRFTAEMSVYLHPEHTGRGQGTLLFETIIPLLKESGLHALTAGITLPNPASVGLHEKFGFEKVAHLKEVGFKFGRWLDVGYWEKLL